MRAASITRGRRTPPQATAAGDKGAPVAIKETATTVSPKKTATAAAAAAVDPPLVQRRAVSAPTKSRAGSSSSCGEGDGYDDEEPARSRKNSVVSTVGDAQAAPGAATAIASERQRVSRQVRQGSASLHASSGRKKPSRVVENRGRRASGSVATVSTGAATAASSTAGTATAAAAATAGGRTEGISIHSDDGGTGRSRRVVARRSSDTARPVLDLAQKEQAWKR